MKIYIKEVDGKNNILPANKIIIIKNGMQTINPTHDMIIADGWSEYIESVEENLEIKLDFDTIKTKKINDILTYDTSEEVNSFFVNGQRMWLDKVTRIGLMLRIDSELENAKTDTVLWFDGNSFKLNLDDAKKMLHKIELYASECYDNTQCHIANIHKLSLIEDIENYDFTIGYPDKLEFNL